MLSLRSPSRLALLAGLLAFAACAPASAVQVPSPALTIASETLTWDDGVTVTFDRGELRAPVNRARGAEPTLGVEVVRFRKAADAPDDVPPIFVLRGGPGYPGIDDELGTSRYYRVYIEPFLAISDVVYVGQRGFGSSTDTACPDRRALTLAEAFDDATRERADRAALDRCRRSWEAAGLDLTGFNVRELAADVADAARALGFERIQLYGNSFGSHAGMTVLRDHPGLVARATFGGLEGPDHTYDSPDGLLRALEAIAASADASEALAPHIPEGGLLAAYRDLIRRADARPIRVRTVHPDTGDSLTVPLDGDDLRELSRGVTRGLAWRYRMPAWPLDILAMLDGDFEAAARRTLRRKTSPRQRNAAFYQLDCASGISAERGARYRRSAAADVIGPVWRDYDLGCAAWDADLGDAFRAGFETDVPTLLVHGTWDMNTPFENALDLLPSFRNHHFVPVEGGSHGAILEAVEVVDGFQSALVHWLATGDADRLPERVELPALAWRAPDAG